MFVNSITKKCSPPGDLENLNPASFTCHQTTTQASITTISTTQASITTISTTQASITTISTETTESSVTTVASSNLCPEEASLSVVTASSVNEDDHDKWGASLALTEPSLTNTGYWHSAEGDVNPSIELKMDGTKDVISVEVMDRRDCCEDKFEDVEVKVGSTFEDSISCGVQSYSSSTTYMYQCPENTAGQHIFIKKLGTTDDVLHVNHVNVKVSGSCSGKIILKNNIFSISLLEQTTKASTTVTKFTQRRQLGTK